MLNPGAMHWTVSPMHCTTKVTMFTHYTYCCHNTGIEHQDFNPLPVQFKALLHGQKGCVFFSGHLNLRTAPETGLPSREKNHNN